MAQGEWGQVKPLPRRCNSLPDDFYQYALPPAAVELAIEDLFPRAKVERAFGDGDDNLAAHNLAFEMRVGVVFPGAVVVVLRRRFMRRELFQPNIVVVEQAVLGIVDIDAGCGVRCPFAKAVLLPLSPSSPSAGNALRPFRTPRRPSATI
jgi:hypothetical protein